MTPRMPVFASVALSCAWGFLIAAEQRGAVQDGPQFTSSGQLLRPANYREWIFLSAGLGMSYGPNTPQGGDAPPFSNVFVNRTAYDSFLKNGTWPDGTLFVLEIRASMSKGSINRGGHFQGDLHAIEAEVKRGGKWSFYGFEGQSPSGARIPDTASCYSCHAAHGAVDNTFVQFYPTLTGVARAKGTLRHESE